MQGLDFEYYCGELLRALGYLQVIVTRASGDFGIDITMEDAAGKKIGVQCKNWKGTVGFQDVWKTESGKNILHLDEVWIITSSRFTKNAYTAARELGIHLYDEQRLVGLIDEARRNYEQEQEKRRKEEEARRAEEEQRRAAEAERQRKIEEAHRLAAEQARRVEAERRWAAEAPQRAEEERRRAAEAERQRKIGEAHRLAAEQAQRVEAARRWTAEAPQRAEERPRQTMDRAAHAERAQFPTMQELDRKFGAFEERRRVNAERVQRAYEERWRAERALLQTQGRPESKGKKKPALRGLGTAAIVVFCALAGLLALFGLLIWLVLMNAG
ncbi:MAG: restriction endonuclease [Christensenellaceae bacterium]|jgi:hypothetical protein|nr:restriction endonuclease [Christensenellaceae bacterium]